MTVTINAGDLVCKMINNEAAILMRHSDIPYAAQGLLEFTVDVLRDMVRWPKKHLAEIIKTRMQAQRDLDKKLQREVPIYSERFVEALERVCSLAVLAVNASLLPHREVLVTLEEIVDNLEEKI
jgi:hypothetical protein